MEDTQEEFHLMGKVMTSKKCRECFFSAGLLLIGLFAAVTPATAMDSKSDALPIIHYAGIIPVQWEKDDTWSDLDFVKATISKDFAEAVRASNRFSTLNDDLVVSMWPTAVGRKELVTDYELQTFATLNMSSRGDMVVMTVRLLSPGFETWLQESDVVPRSWLAESSREQVSSRLADLVHRLINRLPIDAHVTSVNGEFATISGGTDQAVHLGDEFDVVLPKIQTLHPANGSWLTFNTSRTGKIKMVEVKKKSSIGKITSLTYEMLLL